MQKNLTVDFTKSNSEKKNYYFYTEDAYGNKDFLACFYLMLHAMNFTKYYDSWCTNECINAVLGGEIEFAKYVEKYGKVVFAHHTGTNFCVELI